ncbi:MAG TPA: hypothetical protein RMH99_18320 [Sandaracinaceae bacterium LLY-WYZ-13_1]|nr:hypothetical protein [Sandaracinaceae bacterium LLY-WYZ-13_1]
MKRILRLKSVRATLIVGGVATLAMGFSPLLGAPGIESALVLGLLLPPFCGAIGVRVLDSLRREDRPAEAAEVLADALSAALLVVALPVALLLLNTLRVPVCAPLEGLAFLALGPGISVLLAAALGVGIGATVPRVRWATTLAVLAPFALAGLALWRFYDTPAIFAYGHLVGYFPGTIYDPDITVTPTYASFRGLSALWLLGLMGAFAAAWDPEARRPSPSTLRRRWRLGGTAALLLVAGLVGEALGPGLGHRSTPASIAEALGGRLEGERCVVIFPREMPRADARRLAEDCSFRVRRVEQVLGVRQPRPITAYFFRSADEKRALMGASNTYIAKPWRDEVYLQVSRWPHPVLFHEIVHVVAGNIGRGPFRVAGSVGGLLPSPAIIEGTAVAVAWDARQGLTPHQWARAMLEEELAPPLSSVRGLGFLLQPASRAYTTSGSFLRWVRDTQGSDVVRRLYLSSDWEEALGRPVEEAEAEWHAFLREDVALPREARALARLRFERPGIFGQICPHRIANLQDELGADLSAGDDVAAARTCRAILELDEGQASTRATLVGTLARLGRRDAARDQLETLVGPPSAARPLIHRARQGLADALWRRGRGDEALAIYRALMDEPLGEEMARQIEVRVLAIEAGGAAEAALRGLLVPRREANHDPAVLLHHIARLSRVRDDGLAPYLEARQLLFRQRFHLALPRVVEARERGLPTERTETEARRMEAVARFGAGELDASARIWRAILRDDASSPGERVEADDWLARIRHRRPRQ